MKYNREWIESILETEVLIKVSPCGDVPFPHRPYVTNAFRTQVERFKNELRNGMDTSLTQRHIFDLTCLAKELIEAGQETLLKKAKTQYPDAKVPLG